MISLRAVCRMVAGAEAHSTEGMESRGWRADAVLVHEWAPEIIVSCVCVCDGASVMRVERVDCLSN